MNFSAEMLFLDTVQGLYYHVSHRIVPKKRLEIPKWRIF